MNAGIKLHIITQEKSQPKECCLSGLAILKTNFFLNVKI
jgi:hypothetical protein